MTSNQTQSKNSTLTPQEIEKKLRLSIGLFEAAFEIKKHQLQKKHPEKSDRELNHMTMDLIEKGTRWNLRCLYQFSGNNAQSLAYSN